MTKRNLIRVALILVLLFTALAADAAQGVTVTAYRVRTGATYSYVDVVLSNQNPYPVGAYLTIQVELPNGVSRNFQAGASGLQPGNTPGGFTLPFEIKRVRFIQVTRVVV